jgi:hypothetical protein
MIIKEKDLFNFIIETVASNTVNLSTMEFFKNNNDIYQKLNSYEEGIIDGIFRTLKFFKIEVDKKI